MGSGIAAGRVDDRGELVEGAVHPLPGGDRRAGGVAPQIPWRLPVRLELRWGQREVRLSELAQDERMGGGGIGEVAESIRQAVRCGEQEIEPSAARAEAAAKLGLVVLKRTVTSPLPGHEDPDRHRGDHSDSDEREREGRHQVRT